MWQFSCRKGWPIASGSAPHARRQGRTRRAIVRSLEDRRLLSVFCRPSSRTERRRRRESPRCRHLRQRRQGQGHRHHPTAVRHLHAGHPQRSKRPRNGLPDRRFEHYRQGPRISHPGAALSGPSTTIIQQSVADRVFEIVAAGERCSWSTWRSKAALRWSRAATKVAQRLRRQRRRHLEQWRQRHPERRCRRQQQRRNVHLCRCPGETDSRRGRRHIFLRHAHARQRHRQRQHGLRLTVRSGSSSAVARQAALAAGAGNYASRGAVEAVPHASLKAAAVNVNGRAGGAALGGGLYVSGSTLNFSQVTISDNTAQGEVGEMLWSRAPAGRRRSPSKAATAAAAATPKAAACTPPAQRRTLPR